MLAAWKKSYDKPRQRIKKKRCHFANKGLYSQSYGFSSGHVWMWELDHKEGWVLKTMLSNCGAGEDAWEFLGQQGDQTSQSWRNSTLNIHWKNWSWSSSTLAAWYKGLAHLKRPWCRERLKAEGGDRGWNMSLSKLPEIVKDKEAWHAAVQRVAKSWTWLISQVTTITLF